MDIATRTGELAAELGARAETLSSTFGDADRQIAARVAESLERIQAQGEEVTTSFDRVSDRIVERAARTAADLAARSGTMAEELDARCVHPLLLDRLERGAGLAL